MRITIKTLLLVIGILVGGLMLGTTHINASTEQTIYRTGTTTPVTYRNTSTVVTKAADYNYRTQEMRAVWVPTVTGDIAAQKDASITEINAYKNRMIFIFDKMEQLGMNTMIYQVRPMNDATYPSEYSQWSSYLIQTRSNPGWDPLEWIIEEAHKRGIELHAWINPYRLTGATTTAHGQTKEQFAATMPSYNIASDPNMFYKYYASATTSGFALNPGLPQVRQFIYNVVEELITNYNLDAVHMDDYFYYKFDSNSGNSNENRMDDSDYSTFLAYQGSFPNTSAGIANWRREQTSLLVQGISQVIANYNQENNKAVQFGISPTGIYRNGNGTVESGSNTAGQEHYQSYLYADSKRWVESNWIDYIMPQTYWGFEHTIAGYADVVDWWVKVVNRPGINVNLIAAHGIYRALPTAASDWENKWDEVQNEMLFLSKYNTVKGSSFYTFGTFRNTTNQVVQNGVSTLQTYWGKKVPAAPLQRHPDLVTDAVTNFHAVNENGGVKLTWNTVDDARGYMIYRVPMAETVNFSNQTHLLQYVTNATQFMDNGAQVANYKYYIKSVSQANNLSSASQPENIIWPMPTYLNAASITNTQVTLETQENAEYSMNGVNYQDSPIFYNLQPGTTYAFYVRKKATEGVLASDYFVRNFTTLKNPQVAPTHVDVLVYGNQITITPQPNAEYSLNGVTFNQITFYNNLDVLANYTVYIRFRETSNLQASPHFSRVVQTQKWPTDAPENVTFDTTHNSITLEANASFEYSLDGVSYQSSNVFTGLDIFTEYTVYVRYKETGVSLASDDFVLFAKTKKMSQVAPTSLDVLVVDNTITITPIINGEYSIDGINFSDIVYFDQLLPMTEYIVSVRLKETGVVYSSPVYQKSITTQKMTSSSPININYQVDEDRVVFVKFAEYEYSIDGINYQEGSSFLSLSPNTSYTFYIRTMETEQANPSAPLVVTIVTLKTKNVMPTSASIIVYGNTITVEANAAYEYSLNGVTYQSSNEFVGLETMVRYTVYVRTKETVEFAPSNPLVQQVRVERNFQDAPAAPNVEVTQTTIRIIGVPGYEYSFDQINWSRVTYYTKLEPNTTYNIYVRIAQSSMFEASDATLLEVTTLKETNNTGIIIAASVGSPILLGGIGFGLFKLFKRKTF